MMQIYIVAMPNGSVADRLDMPSASGEIGRPRLWTARLRRPYLACGGSGKEPPYRCGMLCVDTDFPVGASTYGLFRMVPVSRKQLHRQSCTQGSDSDDVDAIHRIWPTCRFRFAAPGTPPSSLFRRPRSDRQRAQV